MRSRSVCSMSGASLMGFAVGVAAGVAAGLLAAPMRGSEMRATLRERTTDGSARLQSLATSSRGWAQGALDRALSLIEQGRRAFATRTASEPAPLTATLG